MKTAFAVVAAVLAVLPFLASAPARASDECLDFSGRYRTLDSSGQPLHLVVELLSCEELNRTYISGEHEATKTLVTDGLPHLVGETDFTVTKSWYQGLAFYSQVVWFDKNLNGEPVLRGHVTRWELLDETHLEEQTWRIEGGDDSAQDRRIYLREE
jgi:hypothetical protein